MKNKTILQFVILIVLLFFELGFITFFRGKAGIYLSPILHTLISLGIAIIFLQISLSKSTVRSRLKNRRKLHYLVSLILMLTGIILVFLFYSQLIKQEKPDYRISDIIPTVDILSKRFLMHENVYDVIKDFGYELPPTYLTLQWFPFVISSFSGIDHRWVSLGIWLLSIVIINLIYLKKNAHLWTIILSSTLPFILILILMKELPGSFQRTIEIMVAGYYLLFALSIEYGNKFFRSAGLILTLLSRYATVFFAPLYFGILLIARKSKEAWWLLAGSIILVALLYFLPFGIKNQKAIINGYQYYTRAALDEWKPKSWQKPEDKPFHLFRGVGFAAYFYELAPGKLENKLALLKKVHLSVLIFSVFVLLLVYKFFKEKYTCSNYLLFSLKVYLTVFYALIQVPYTYLFFVPLFLSMYMVISSSKALANS